VGGSDQLLRARLTLRLPEAGGNRQLGIDWASAPFDVEQFRQGMEVELEHGLHDPRTNVSGDDSVVTGRSPSLI
jgi:hypothetical protein